MAEDNKIVLKVQVEQGGSTVTLKNFENQVIKSGIAIKDLSNSIGNFTTSKLKMDGQVKVTTDQFKRLEKSVGGFKTAAGASTSATLELGRVLSDMPYGIRGVANNLQQLASNLFFMSKATDVATGKSVGFGGALKNLVGGLIGPAGILIAFQGIIALFDYFSTGTKKAEEETNNLNLSIGGSATKLKALKKALDDGLMSREEANEAVNAANKEFKDLNLTLSDNVKLTKDSVLAINNKIEALVNLSKAQALQALLEKKYSELLPLQAKQSELDAKATEAEINAVEALSKNYKEFGTAKEEALASSARSAAKENERAVEKIEKDISDLLKLSTDNGILDLMFNGKNKGKEKRASKIIDPKSFEADLFEVEKMLRGFRYNDLKESAKTEQQKAAAKSLIELDKFKQNYYEYVNSEAKKFDKFKENLDKQLKAKKISEDSYNSALSTAEEERRKGQKSSYENFLIGLKAISDKYSPDIIGEGITVTTTLAEQAKKDAKIKLDGQLKAFLEYAKSAKIALTEISSFLQAESDRELTIEQNKTNALNQELNNRLLNENLSKDQRASIQNQIAINDEKLRKKQNKIKEKAFKTQKAFNIALAVTDTITAGIGAARATYGGPIAKIAAMTATIGAGMLQVAMIARQKFQPDAANTPVNVGSSSAGGGSARAEPSFNIVGRSNDNILISAIQSQFDQPLRAYVVARDVTNQQQLDGVISGAAST